MRVTATADAADFIGTHGGQLFVWSAEHRSARLTLAFLKASVAPPRRSISAGSRRGASCSSWTPHSKHSPKNCSWSFAAAVIRISRLTGTGSPTLSVSGADGEGQKD